tara:strand:+ start:412 stop:2730 length:2319 start_codon:yes stop_codon:yes gene_type:complete
MNIILKCFLYLILFFSITNAYSAPVTFNQKSSVNERGEEDVGSGSDDDDFGLASGIEFNKDGTKMFVSFGNKSGDDEFIVAAYNLSTPYDVSTETFADERCVLDNVSGGHQVYDLELNSDGTMLFVATRQHNVDDADGDRVYRYDLSTPYDISTCSTLASRTTDLDQVAFTNGSKAGDFDDVGLNRRRHRLQAIEINNDGSKLFLTFYEETSTSGTRKAKLYEYILSTPYDLSTLSLVKSAGIGFSDSSTNGVDNPSGMRFSPGGKRIFITSHGGTSRLRGVTQISLTRAFDTSSFTIDGTFVIDTGSNPNQQPRGISFSSNGLKMYISQDRDQKGPGAELHDRVFEYDLACPYNIVSGQCPSITEDDDRAGIAIAQIEIAKRTIDHSTETALNRLKWIRRNKDKQNLTNLNIDFNFTNQRLASLTEIVRTSAEKKKTKDLSKEQDIFYWSEGSIAVGRVGDTDFSSTNKIKTDAITVGADKFTDNNSIKGLAFRFGSNDVDVGKHGSTLDTDTYNITYYSTSPVENDTKFLDTIIGIGRIESDILTVLNGNHYSATRTGKQVYFTQKIKDELKKNDLTLIPSAQIDFGHTILDSYSETGSAGLSFDDQVVRTVNVSAAIAFVDDLSNEENTIKRHGRLEYKADLDQTSNLKYRYKSGGNSTSTNLKSGSRHNLNGQIGFDIVFPDRFSLFMIYERDQALGSGHTDKIHLAIGYLPNKNTNYIFKIEGSEYLLSNIGLKKNISGLDLSLNVKDDLMNLGDKREASILLNKVF